MEALAAHVHGMTVGKQRLAGPGQALKSIRNVDHGVTDDEDAHPTLQTLTIGAAAARCERSPFVLRCAVFRSARNLGRWQRMMVQ